MLYCAEHKPGMARNHRAVVIPWLAMYSLHLKYQVFATKLSFRLEHPPLERLVRAGSRTGRSTAETLSSIGAKEQSSCRDGYN